MSVDGNYGPLCACGCGEPTYVSQGRTAKYKLNHDKRKPFRYAINESTGCWIWLGSRNVKTGYGTARSEIGGQDYAHRVFFRRYKGEIPRGYVIDHLCRTPACVNPEHLQAVPNAINVRRGLRGYRLTEADVQMMRAMRAGGSMLNEIARRFNTDQSYVSKIIRGIRFPLLGVDDAALAPFTAPAASQGEK